MQIRLLGPVEVWASGQRVPVGPPQRQAVLAALAVDAGRPVPVQTLIDRVWGDTPPEQARGTLHSYLGRIRKILDVGGRAPTTRLIRRSGGYVLECDPDLVDVHRFGALVSRA